jgi:acyl-CoA thioesterase-1
MFTVLLNSLLSKACRASAQYLRLLCCAVVIICTQSHAASDQLSEHNASKDNSSTSSKVVLVLGDSLSAAYGLTQEQGWVSLLQDVLSQHDDPDLATIKIINASISGETTDGGLARLTRLLQQHQPTDVLIELGGNDGLQGHSIKKLKANMRAMIKQSLAAGTQVAVQQMQIPTNYGSRYNNMFMNAFSQIATESQVPLVPFFLTDIALQPELMQNDGIHPTADAQPLIAQFMLDNWIIPLVQR